MKLSVSIRDLARVAYYEFKVGDYIWFGKYKNKKGKIVEFKKDIKGFDVAVVEPVPKGRKQNKDILVYKFRPMTKEDTEKYKAANVPPFSLENPYHMDTKEPALPRGEDEDEPDLRTAAGAFKNKKEVPKADGKGTTTVYEYSDNHLKKREKGKAKKVNHLMTAMPKIVAKAKKDLKSDTPRTRLTALAVLLMDATYERVGNKESAEEGHYGVTSWKKKHLTISGGTATLKYTGKSGVDHVKKITDATLVRELRTLAFDKSKGDYLLYAKEGDCCIEARDVNAYLKKSGITAKDIRGYHANRLMKEKLEALTAATDDDPKAQETARKEQFKEALEAAAEEVGHESSTLRSQYLAPSLEKDFIDDGKVNKSVSASTWHFEVDKNPSQITVRAIQGETTLGLVTAEEWKGESTQCDDHLDTLALAVGHPIGLYIVKNVVVVEGYQGKRIASDLYRLLLKAAAKDNAALCPHSHVFGHTGGIPKVIWAKLRAHHTHVGDLVWGGTMQQKTAAQSDLHKILDSVQEWADLLQLHHNTLEKLIDVAEGKRHLRSKGIKVVTLEYGDDVIKGTVEGSTGNTYHPHITIQPRRGHYCTCPDWQRNGRRLGPCKHILALSKDARSTVLDNLIEGLQTRLAEVEDLLASILEHAEF